MASRQCSVTINDYDHKLLWAALEDEDVTKKSRPSNSQFIADLAENQLSNTDSIDSRIAEVERITLEIHGDLSKILTSGISIIGGQIDELAENRKKGKARMSGLS